MRRVIFTETQLNEILQAESAYPLDIKGDDGKPDNSSGYEVAVNNTTVNDTTPNPKSNVTIGDRIAGRKSRKKKFGLSSPSYGRIAEGDALDNMKTSGYGQKSDEFISKVASNNGGKMVSNLNAEIKSNTDASRNNTNQVRVSRMEAQKKNDPVTFQKNGGERTLKILKNQVNLKSGEHKAMTAGQVRKTDNTPNANKTPESHHNDSVYYFK